MIERKLMNYQACNGIVYVIKPGDTLYKLSQRYGIPTTKILRANPYINIYNLQIGDKICIPTEGNMSVDQRMFYTVGEDETIKTVLERLDMNLIEFLALNPIGTLVLKPGLQVAVSRNPREENS